MFLRIDWKKRRSRNSVEDDSARPAGAKSVCAADRCWTDKHHIGKIFSGVVGAFFSSQPGGNLIVISTF
jgi:hypothetical protein